MAVVVGIVDDRAVDGAVDGAADDDPDGAADGAVDVVVVDATPEGLAVDVVVEPQPAIDRTITQVASVADRRAALRNTGDRCPRVGGQGDGGVTLANQGPRMVAADSLGAGPAQQPMPPIIFVM